MCYKHRSITAIIVEFIGNRPRDIRKYVYCEENVSGLIYWAVVFPRDDYASVNYIDYSLTIVKDEVKVLA